MKESFKVTIDIDIVNRLVGYEIRDKDEAIDLINIGRSYKKALDANSDNYRRQIISKVKAWCADKGISIEIVKKAYEYRVLLRIAFKFEELLE